MKKTLLITLITCFVGGTFYLFAPHKTTQNNPIKNQTIPQATTSTSPSTPVPKPVGKLKVALFSGKLEKVHPGCFVDGECYVEVGGKHVTAIRGWSQEIVGSVQGATDFGDLQNYLGQQVEVYAQDQDDGSYTLYGSEGFYIKVNK